MSPLSRMRNSRNDWKMKNRLRRKKVNLPIKKISASQAKVERREAEIQELKVVMEASKNITNQQPPDIAEIIKRLEDENRRQKEEIQRLENENEKKQQEIEKLQEELDSKKACISHPQGRKSAQVLCVYLLVTCGVSFRSISKILQALIDLGVLLDFGYLISPRSSIGPFGLGLIFCIK